MGSRIAALAMALMIGCHTADLSTADRRTAGTTACDPLPEDGAPCTSGLCPVPGETHSYFQCTGGTWREITEQPREDDSAQGL